MSEDEYRFLTLRHLPVRATVDQVAWILNCTQEDIHALTRENLLKALGNPPPNGKKLYRTKDILDLAGNPAWLARMTNSLYGRNREKNHYRTSTAVKRNGHIQAV